jgi:hypothetical protein
LGVCRSISDLEFGCLVYTTVFIESIDLMGFINVLIYLVIEGI